MRRGESPHPLVSNRSDVALFFLFPGLCSTAIVDSLSNIDSSIIFKYFDDEHPVISSPIDHPSRRRRRNLAVDGDERLLGFRFLTEPSSVVTSRDGAALLHCQHSLTRSTADARLEWRKDGTAISALRNVGRILVLNNGSLSIEDAVPSDEGTYQCSIHVTYAGTTWTFVSRRAWLRLPLLSRFEQQPKDRTVLRGSTVALQCVLSSRPRARIEWYRNDRLLQPDSDRSIVILPESYTLEMASVQSNHIGAYKCIAKNGDKERVSREARIDIHSDQYGEHSEPSFALEPTGQVVSEGENIILECAANGWAKPEIRWLHGSQSVNVDGDRIRLVGSGSLLILKARVDDAGVYTCRASNAEDSIDASATVQVKVPPSLIKKPKDTVAQETTDVELECEADGKPGATVGWYKNGEAIIPSEYFVIEATKLRVLGLVKNDQGVYQCHAESDAGSVQASAQLLVDVAEDSQFNTAGSDGEPRLPGEPLSLQSSHVASRLVTLRWDPPVMRHGSILLYHVFYKENGSTRERASNSTAQTLTITHLQPNTSYIFRVAAENEAGVGKTSNQLRITTLQERAVPGRVMGLKATALSPGTIEVQWQRPSSDGPIPSRYKLFYIAKADRQSGEKETQIVTMKTSYTIHGMNKFTEYSIRVEAEGENGAGLSSEPVTIRTQSDVPSAAPRNIRVDGASTSSVVVQWQPPAPEDCNGIITGYRIKYKTKLKGNKGTTLVVEGASREQLITGLDPATHYLIRMAAVNQNGTGPNSDWVRVETLLEDKEEVQIPGPPTSLKVQPGADAIQLSWTPPSDPGVMIRGYLVGWGINIPDVEQNRISASHRHYIIEHLRPGRDYVVSLRAFNRMGNGFPIYETVRTIAVGQLPKLEPAMGGSNDNSAQQTPVAVRAEAQSNSAIRVSWMDAGDEDEDEDEMPHPRLYTIRYGTSNDDGQLHYVNSTDTEVVVDGLQPNTQYEFAVRVSIGRSASQWSMAAFNRTLPSPPSSAPRDLTVSKALTGDPHSVMLNWQPPKYANGDIEEYLIFYSDRPDVSEKEWHLEGAQGDSLTATITGLLPKVPYYFKIQARNSKGYGPLSAVVKFVPGTSWLPGSTILSPAANPPRADFQLTPTILGIAGGIAGLILLLLILLIAICLRRRSGTKGSARYTAGKRSTTDSKAPPDLWINQPNNNSAQQLRSTEYIVDSPAASMHDLKRGTTSVDSPPPRYQSLTAMTTRGGSVDAAPERRIGRARPMPVVVHETVGGGYHSDIDCNGTLSRSYHQSSASLEGGPRQRTPQVVYTGSRHTQPTAKIDFGDRSSSAYGSAQALTPPPPQLPSQAPPALPPSFNAASPSVHDGYRTLRVTQLSQANNPLQSFSHMAAVPPPMSPQNEARTAHIVRPVVVTSPQLRGGKPAGVVIGQKASGVPIGRAAPSPRIVSNMSSIYSPYAACGFKDETRPLQHSASTEDLELNAQVENLDTMIEDLQAMQSQFHS